MEHSCETVVEYHPSMTNKQGLKRRLCSLVGGERSARSADFNVEDTNRAVSPIKLWVRGMRDEDTYKPFPGRKTR